MTGLPDPGASRAVLIGVHAYEALDDLPAVEQNLTGLRDVFTDPALWGLPESNCVLAPQPPTARTVLDTVWDAAAQATDALIVYFAGHGLTDPHTDELCLALPDSDPERLYTALPYESLRRVILGAGRQARRKVVILDCCYSGRALVGGMSASTHVADQAAVDGTYLLTASAETRKALAPPGERYTAFTGELISTLSDGIPGGPAFLDMETVYRQLHTRLSARSRPLPQQRNRNAGARIALVRNAGGSADPEPPPPSPAFVVRHPLWQAHEGVTLLASKIAPTLGPWPRSVTFTAPDGTLATTTDPAVICDVSTGSDVPDEPGTDLIPVLVRRMRAEWSDGAATAVVMADAMINTAFDVLRVGMVSADHLAARLATDGGRAVELLRSRAAEVKSTEQLLNVVETATGDPAGAASLAKAAEHVGREGVIHIERRGAPGVALETHEGMFLPAAPGGSAGRTYTEPLLFLLTEPPPADLRQWASPEERPVLLLSPDADTDTIVIDLPGGDGPALRVHADDPLGTLDDIAVLTGADLSDPRSPGTVTKIVISAAGLHLDHRGRYDVHRMVRRIDELREKAASASTDAERDNFRLRMAQLAGGVATVWLGPKPSEPDAALVARLNTLARARDGLSALIEHGFVDGAGVALHSVATALTQERTGGAAITVLCAGLSAPYHRLAAARGHSVMVGVKDSAAVLAGAVTAAVETTQQFLALA
ncbi:hypothetical protein E1264_11435 [Actinomadura sp. KC216]|uniref:caspase, EACC1-associated type n=1 Tax=Actinomadura sp. KC216 TaxID=2530370 RepID=UPI0010536057|nr:caspase family protein [Actinomadura sp. KC216]TDB88469.1 hypothetical protein E1264_11435 [Actinomadura sp. KC216]